jgi:hypothetical protein
MRCGLPSNKPLDEDTLHAALLLLRRHGCGVFSLKDCPTIDTLGMDATFSLDCLGNFPQVLVRSHLGKLRSIEQLFLFETAP